ncbi:MAG: phage holin family protein [Hafnia alvei]|uniref:phage holin family protein n=1 Tax=Hafnia alvei TaxID=569 RepID=UPI00267126AD|nr:phage holin family protein [Hafnia alvei]
MIESDKTVVTLFLTGALIVVGKVLAGGEPITPRLFIGRMLLGGFVSMVSGVVLVQFPEINPVAIYGIAAMLGIAGYQVVEIFIQRRLSKENKTYEGDK